MASGCARFAKKHVFHFYFVGLDCLTHQGGNTKKEKEGSTLFAILCWLLWKSRNNFIFNNNHSNVEYIVTIGETWTTCISKSKSKDIYRVQRIVGDS